MIRRPVLAWIPVALALGTGVAPASERIEWRLGQDPAILAELTGHLPVPPRYAAEHQADLLVRIDIDYGPSEIRQRVRRFTYYGTVDGVQQGGTTSLTLDARSERLIVHEAMVVAGDASSQRFDPQTVQVRDTDSYDVFTDEREVILQLPGLAAGGVVVLDYERVIDRAALSLPWVRVIYPKTLRPRRLFELEIAWGEVQPAWAHDVEGVDCNRTAGRLSCMAREIAPAPTDPDVLYRDVLPAFVVADAVTWEDVIAAVRDGIEGALAADAGVDALYEQLTKGESALATRLERVHGFASREVRYVSFSEGRHDVVPHAVATTVANRFGDCKDKSALLLALLERAGVDAYPVLVATDRTNPARLLLPGAGYFDHMIVCIAEPSGGERCLDPTDPSSGVYHTAHGVQGLVRLVLEPGRRPSRVPVDEYRWRLEVEADLGFDSDGSQTEQLTLTYPHAYASVLRSASAAKSPEELTRWAVKRYQDVVSDRVTPQISFSGLAELDPQVTIRSRARHDALVGAGVALDYSERSAWLTSMVGNLETENRHYDYAFPGLRVRTRYRFDVTSAWRVTGHGADLALEHTFGSLRRRHERAADGTLVVHTELRVPQRTVPVGEIASFNRFLTIVKRESTMSVLADVK